MCKECKGHKEFKEYKMPYIANGNRMFYNSFDELTDDLKNKFKSDATRLCSYNSSRKGYVGFINKLNENGDELVGDYVNTKTKVRIRYGKCGHTHPEGEGVVPSNYKREPGCAICCGRLVVENINDLATKRPELAKEWHPTKNGDLKPTQVTFGSNKKVWWLCECGHEWEATICNRVGNDNGCPNCGDGISYPEKLMALVLEKLEIEFTRQLTYDNGKHRYDFYIASWKAIYETHGMQHYEGWNYNKEDLIRQQNNDEYKRNDAINNGIKEEDYHEIDCRRSILEWCRPNIEKALSKYIDISILTDEDWKEFDKEAQKSKKVEVCLYWKEQKEADKDLTTTIIAEIFNVDKTTIRRWLTWGNESGLCIYNGEEERKTKNIRVSKFVYLIKQDGTKWYNEAMSQKELSILTRISFDTISNRRRDGKPLDGKNAKYDSKYIGSYIIEAK